MFLLRTRRLRLAEEYAARYEPVSSLLFRRSLPRGSDWRGTRELLSNPSYCWVEGVWTHVASTVPFDAVFGPSRTDRQLTQQQR